MRAAVLSIGSEITRGELTDTNSAWLGERLTALGFEVVAHATVDDDHDRIVDAVRHLAAGHRIVVATGGLGPTTDDLTTEAVAAALGTRTTLHEPSLSAIKRRWARFGRQMPPSNVKQAHLPEGADALPNPEGTAPGFAVAVGDARCFFMPGVPREMRRMFEEQVTPALQPLARRDSHQIHLRTFGMTESGLGERLAGVEVPGITIGYRASFPEIEVKILARADDEAEAQRLATQVATEVRARLGATVYGGRDDSFAGVVGDRLRDRGLRLAVAESCTGGMVGAMLTSVPGSSDYVLLDAVTYSNSAKTAVLGVSPETLRAHGAVSSECAAAMAEGARRVADADVAVSITGIAGPGGGTDDKPVGTVWFGLACRDAVTVTRKRRLPGDRDRVRTLASYVALQMVLRAADGERQDDDAAPPR